LNRPELTDERFIAHPFAPNRKLYKTGDLARFLTNGDIQFIGRADKQVKVRGHRIEPGEIEAVVKRFPGLSHCTVLLHGKQHPRLIALYIATANDRIDVGDLRLFLKGELPGYMVPAQLMQVAEFPLTQNGKLDEAALMESSRPAEAADPKMVLPRTAEEKL